MPSSRELRNRIRGVDSTRQITRAMELVATSRLRRSQEAVLARRPYADKINDVIRDLMESTPPDEGVPTLMESREIQRRVAVILTTNRGLCGALNINTVRFALEHLQTVRGEAAELVLVGIGKVGLRMLAGAERIIASFTDISDRPGIDDVLPLARLVIDGFEAAEFDAVDVIYPEFVNTLVQRPVRFQLLPVVLPEEAEIRSPVQYLYEPNAMQVLDSLLPRYVEMELYRAVLELTACEQSARMVAMRSATENANDLTDDLRLTYNRQRQSAITSEMIDIASGANALAQ